MIGETKEFLSRQTYLSCGKRQKGSQDLQRNREPSWGKTLEMAMATFDRRVQRIILWTETPELG